MLTAFQVSNSSSSAETVGISPWAAMKALLLNLDKASSELRLLGPIGSPDLPPDPYARFANMVESYASRIIAELEQSLPFGVEVVLRVHQRPAEVEEHSPWVWEVTSGLHDRSHPNGAAADRP